MNVMKNKKGQAMTEYIIIVAVVALAALTVFGFFGDTIRAKMNGVIAAFGGQSAGISPDQVNQGDSTTVLKDLDQDASNIK
jgi:pilus assembly protein Flp/PilA